MDPVPVRGRQDRGDEVVDQDRGGLDRPRMEERGRACQDEEASCAVEDPSSEGVSFRRDLKGMVRNN